ncbi:sulfurtransferase (plasmid) [Haloferacaceae archaeon DSL9]
MTSKMPLVSPEWVLDRIDEFQGDDPRFRLVEVTGGPTSSSGNHIPGAVTVDWKSDLEVNNGFDIPQKYEFEEVIGSLGITDDSTVVVYSGEKNSSAAYVYWQLSYYGHDDVRLLDGGKEYWNEQSYPVVDTPATFQTQSYVVDGIEERIRIDTGEVESAISEQTQIVGIRRPKEHTGALGYSLLISLLMLKNGVSLDEAYRFARRSLLGNGHIQGTVNIPLTTFIDENGRLKSPEELQSIAERHQLIESQEIIVYCAAGHRSSLAWFIFHELLNYDSVKNYDGSWVRWASRSWS